MSKFRFDKPVVYLGYGILSISVVTFVLAILVFGVTVLSFVTMYRVNSKSEPAKLQQSRLTALKKANLEVPKDVLQNCAKSGKLNEVDASRVQPIAAEKIRRILVKCDKASKSPGWYNEDLAIMTVVFWGFICVLFIVFGTAGWFVGRHLTQKTAVELQDLQAAK